ncbi:MAG: methyltransferase domain-containing protein [Acidimicrobiia bacterium]|nr:methyltransferase domain-containing protein [Acidimicrobiia bacterium]MXZ85369.1 methyltransferase domain-containing protein [Acidimicrobiia bacterium]MYE73063.1 methyltransferase domain-containing protein [Acidimicrobiia bacterium]MYG73070.1 methyltransferase domain-containing protein [Acidimicrobiia bacterium]MYH95447.1 methyltransferase domain-containing protein [Acidimicrobiia bacterium]
MADSPYPELKKSHVPERVGRPWTDYKPPPSAPVWAVISGFGSFHVLAAALELGVFDALADRGATPGIPPTVTAEELAEELEASSPHLEALLDSLAVLGLLERVGGRYGLNDTAARYLTTDGAASMASLVPVAPGPLGNWSRLADTIRAGQPAEPIDDDPADFYRPLVEGTFTTMLRAATRADFQVRYSALESPRVLDLGAGGAPWAIAVLKACPGATAVINDLDGVIDVAQRTTAEYGVADRCEFRPGDFHTIEIESEGYDIVVLGHVCRTEGPSGAQQLIARAVDALRPEGRLLLADYFVAPEPQWSPHSVLMGMTMMASTINGFGITAAQVAEWLAETGFEAIRLIEPIGHQYAYVATKSRRPPGGSL